MSIIELSSFNYKPNIRLSKNYFIIFGFQCLTLYDLEGNMIDKMKLSKYIEDICIINNNTFVIFTKTEIILKTDNGKNLKFINRLHRYDDIYEYYKYKNINYKINKICYYDSFFSKENNLLFVSYNKEIIIMEFIQNALLLNVVQTINIQNSFLLNFSKNSFISYNGNKILIYQKIKGFNKYQLKSKFSMNNYYIGNYCIDFHNLNIVKLDNKTILFSIYNHFYLSKIQTTKIVQNSIFFTENKDIDFIRKIDNKIYVCTNNITYIFYYSNNKICFICSINLSNVCILNYLTNLCFYKFYHKLDRKVKLFCPEKNIINKSKIGWHIFKFQNVLDFFVLLDLRMIERNLDHSESYFRVINVQDYFFAEDFYYLDGKRDQETIIVNEFNFIIKNNRLILNKYNIKRNEEISVENEDKYFIFNINEFILGNNIGENHKPFKNIYDNNKYFIENNINYNELNDLELNKQKKDNIIIDNINLFSKINLLNTNIKNKRIFCEEIIEELNELKIYEENKVEAYIDEIKTEDSRNIKLINIAYVFEEFKQKLKSKIQEENEYQYYDKLFNDENINNFKLEDFFSFMEQHLISSEYSFCFTKKDVTNFNLLIEVIKNFNEIGDIYNNYLDINI